MVKIQMCEKGADGATVRVKAKSGKFFNATSTQGKAILAARARRR